MTVDVGAQLRKGVVEYCILGLLATEPTYGWKLSEALVSRGLIASIGTLYPILSRLRAQGLVSSFDQQSDAGPSRRYYRVTNSGHLQLATFREQWGPFARTVNELVGEDTP
jgi:PadR family transcriptional regulator PadR